MIQDADGPRAQQLGRSPKTLTALDANDRRVSGTHLSRGVGLILPAGPGSIVSPLDASSVLAAWSLPLPDSNARWGTDLRGLMTTPTGLVQSAEATPQTIGSGVIVFSSGNSEASAVGIRGLEGSTRAFELRDGGWKAL